MTIKQWCAKHGYDEVHFATIKMLVSRCEPDELAALVLAMSTGSDPRSVKGYNKVKLLWSPGATEKDPPIIRDDDKNVFIFAAGPIVALFVGGLLNRDRMPPADSKGEIK